MVYMGGRHPEVNLGMELRQPSRREFLEVMASASAALLFNRSRVFAGQQSSFLDPSILRSPITDTENSFPGTLDWKLGRLAVGGELEGYCYSHDDLSPGSVGRGETLDVCVNTVYPKFHAELFRMGDYDGLHGRKITDIVVDGQRQIMPQPDKNNFNTLAPRWDTSFAFKVPKESYICPSGYYLWKLTGLDGNGNEQAQKFIPFIMRDDLRPADVLIKIGNATDHAYNPWGGKCLYDDLSLGKQRSFKVSLLRPYEQINVKTGERSGDGTGAGIKNLRILAGANVKLSGGRTARCDMTAYRWGNALVFSLSSTDMHMELRPGGNSGLQQLLRNALVEGINPPSPYWTLR